MPQHYWESETPVTVTTSANVLALYRESLQLSVSKVPYADQNGTTRYGKTVSINLNLLLAADRMTLTAARDIFRFILERLNRQLEKI